MRSLPLHHLVVGPPQHGVTRYAELLLAAAEVPSDHVVRRRSSLPPQDLAAPLAGPAAELLARLPAAAPVHLHVTDHLLGGPEQSLQLVQALAAGRRLVLTLHDLPQPSDGVPLPRRRAGYAGMVAAADVVVVSSEHEAALLRELPLHDRTTPVLVVPLAHAGQLSTGQTPTTQTSTGPVLPVATPPEDTRQAPSPRQVAVLGFVYPGKGHEQVLAAMAGLPGDVGLRVLGAASPGHEDMVRRLQEQGTATGRPVQVDGWVPDERLPALLRAVAVPVFAPRHVSASASVTAWTAAGRRPVATRNRYSEELQARRPGSLLLVDDTPAALAAGLAAALADPDLTHLDPDHDPGPCAAEAARLTFAALTARGAPA